MVRHRNGRELGTERTNGLIGAWARAREERGSDHSAIEKKEGEKEEEATEQ